MALTAAQIRPFLDRLARERRVVTYRDAAAELGVQPPHTIHQVVLALEETMAADAAADQPFAAALVVSKNRDGLPAPGFFSRAHELGRYQGPEQGRAAEAFHRAEVDAVLAAQQSTGVQSTRGGAGDLSQSG